MAAKKKDETIVTDSEKAPAKAAGKPITLKKKVKISPNGCDVFAYGPGETPSDTPKSHIDMIKESFPDEIAK